MKIDKFDQLSGRHNCESEIVTTDPVGEKYNSCSTLLHKYQTNPKSVLSDNFSREYYGNSVSSSFSTIWSIDK